MPRIKPAAKNTEFGRALIAAFKEVLAHQRGEIELPTIDFGPRGRKKSNIKTAPKTNHQKRALVRQ